MPQSAPVNLRSWGFQSFLWTQFLGAFNDNVFKLIVSLVAVDRAIQAGGTSQYLSIAGVVFMIPFFLFSGYSGHVADVFSKRHVLIFTKCFEIVAMGLGVIALYVSRLDMMMAVLFLMALHSTFFSPAKYGIVPEMLPDADLSRANGLLEMSTFLAIILGTSIGSLMFAAWKNTAWIIGFCLFGIAVIGTVVSFSIARVPVSGARDPFRLNPWGEVGTGIKHLYRDKPLWLTVIAISYFWFLGALLQMDLLLFGKEVLHAAELQVGILLTCLAAGIGFGSVAAGRLSGEKVELGLVPLGSIGMGIFSLTLAFSRHSYTAACISLALLGFWSGLFIVPLNAYLQQKSAATEKGRLLATNNFLNTIGILLASGVLWALHDLAHFSAARIILIFGIFTMAATVYVIATLPEFLIRFSLWMLTHTIYRIRIVGPQNVPSRGPALLVCNHVSHVDAFLVNACVQRFIRFLIYRPYYEIKAVHWLFKRMHAIPVSTGGRRDVIESLRRARQELIDGHVVCIFAEGAISRTGNLLPFRKGLERIVTGLDVPIIPVHLDRLWGSIFSFKNGRFFWKWPERIPYPVTVSFGAALPATAAATAQQVRQAIMELGSDAIPHRRNRNDLLHRRFVRTAKRNWKRRALSDSSGKNLSFGKTLIASLMFARWLHVHRPHDRTIGILLPSSIAGALSNAAVLLAGKIPINLNFTAGADSMRSAIDQCSIQAILTSRLFLSKLKMDPPDGAVYVEDVLKEFTKIDKVRTAIAAAAFPTAILSRMYSDGRRQMPGDLATIIFSSGSTAQPKGVMLSHHNVISNLEAMAQVFWVTKDDCILGVLPFFHSFGFTVTLWLPLIGGFRAAYHVNPMDAKVVGEMLVRERPTLFVATPTFCSAYARKCTREQFGSLRFLIVGGERLRQSFATTFEQEFGIQLLEGYGCTEMSPVISVNAPDVEDRSERHIGRKSGSVGHPLPGVALKIVDPETGEALPAASEGLLLAKGPNRMLGYLNQPEKTNEAIRDGWYSTGDIAVIDEDGFLRITDRLSRFSKIAGEMVPHLKVEDAINNILGELSSVVTSVPDEQKGERLVALYAKPEMSPAELWRRLNETDLQKLWIPKRESLIAVESLPTLGTGKIDLRQARAIAVAHAIQPARSAASH